MNHNQELTQTVRAAIAKMDAEEPTRVKIEANKIIASLPAIIAGATRAGNNAAFVMDLIKSHTRRVPVQEATTNWKILTRIVVRTSTPDLQFPSWWDSICSKPEPSLLGGIGKIVYDYCEEQGLNPSIKGRFNPTLCINWAKEQFDFSKAHSVVDG